jgi:hypothetical protein
MLTMAALLSIGSLGPARAAISYSTAGSLYTENFDGLPTDAPNNASIETVYTDGWRDDTTTVAGTHVSVPGWHLFHPLSPATENGFNGNQRLRFGAGSSNTGSFYGFSAGGPTDTEKALGEVGSTTIAANGANLYFALRLVNNTGGNLSSFTLTFDGEQWRRGDSATGETMTFDYSTTATTADWFSTATFNAVPSLDYTSPVLGATGAVNGNTAGRVEDISATVNGISWAPGGELWLRWAATQIPGVDDGLAIDDVRFAAVPEPATLSLFSLGAMALLGRRRRS